MHANNCWEDTVHLSAPEGPHHQRSGYIALEKNRRNVSNPKIPKGRLLHCKHVKLLYQGSQV